MRHLLLAVPLFVLAIAPPAGADRARPRAVLHEPVPADPREDVALSVPLDGELPAAIDTPQGLVTAPDPARPLGTGASPYGPAPSANTSDSSFRPDRDTRRPNELPYDDPFSPSTAPFKRLSAFDTVDAPYTLSVRDPRSVLLPISPLPPTDASEERFYADMVVDLVAGTKVRIPSVGPGTRVLHARAGIGTEDVRFYLYRDGAENWFIEGERSTRARVVMELAIARSAFGGEFGNPTWADLAPVPALPPNVDRAADEVSTHIGVSRKKSPHDTVTQLVKYFRSFTDSDEPPPSSRDIYLDLALSKKGVCRHRAFAFMVTARHLGIPTRMIVNEAHAWVEVHDGKMFRRIDLGGAGRTLHDPLSSNVPYEPPPDPFDWPEGGGRGEDLGRTAPPAGDAGAGTGSGNGGSGSGSGGAGSGGTGSSGAGSGGAGSRNDATEAPTGAAESRVPDDRPGSRVTMTMVSTSAHRGAPLQIRGEVSADGDVCGHVAVKVVLRSRAGEIVIGQLATDERGAYDGSIVVPSAVPLGDYEVHASTAGDARCGRGGTK